MPDNRKVTVAIMCYGLHYCYARMSTEIKGLDEYLGCCAKYIARLFQAEQLSGVVLCGGYTDEIYSDMSEAATNASYLKGLLSSMLIPVEKINFCLEESSRNTAQNIVFTGQLIAHGDPFTIDELREAKKNDSERAMTMRKQGHDWLKLSRNIVFICDKPRKLKVWVMLGKATGSLAPDFNLRVKAFPRADIHPNSRWYKQWILALLYLAPSKFSKELNVKNAARV